MQITIRFFVLILIEVFSSVINATGALGFKLDTNGMDAMCKMGIKTVNDAYQISSELNGNSSGVVLEKIQTISTTIGDIGSSAIDTSQKAIVNALDPSASSTSTAVDNVKSILGGISNSDSTPVDPNLDCKTQGLNLLNRLKNISIDATSAINALDQGDNTAARSLLQSLINASQASDLVQWITQTNR